jgi:hypothetical protein
VREAARQGTLRAADLEVRVIAERWEHFLDYLALGLAQDLGRDVAPARARKEATATRIDGLVHQLVSTGELGGALRVPDTIAPLELRADLRARQVMASVRVDAPGEGRPTAQLNWMLRQLRDAAPDLLLQVSFTNVRETTSMSLAEARELPQRALHPTDPKRKIRAFVIAMNRPMGTKRGKGAGSLVRERRRQVLDFYAAVVQDLKAWQARAPQLPDARGDVPRTSQPDPPHFSAVDQRDLGEGVSPRDEPEAAETVDAPSPQAGLRVEEREGPSQAP